MILKPVSLLALDDDAARLAAAVQERVAAACGLDDLVQWRPMSDGAIESIHAQRQRPESPLRQRDDVSTRELVLLVASAAGPGGPDLGRTAARIRQEYETRRLASVFTIEILCLLPEVTGSDGYSGAYAVLKALHAADPKPFHEVWLVDAVNGSRVKFGPLAASCDVYADAVAGALQFEPEMSGALPGLRPRGMLPMFSSFGYASLVFPRDAALHRVAPRFAAELVALLLSRTEGEEARATLLAKQFVVGQDFALPPESLFHRFQPKAAVTERTRTADEVIAAVRADLETHRNSVHLASLDALTKRGEEKTAGTRLALANATDALLDRAGHPPAIAFLDALLDPLADVRADADLAPRNLVTEMNTATAALDERLRFAADTRRSDVARKRVRELTTLLAEQQLVAETLAPVTAETRLAEMKSEQASLLGQLPEVLFAEEAANNAARNAARDAEAARLAAETEAREQQLRELFAQKPRAEHALREALEVRRSWLWRQVLGGLLGGAALYGGAFAFGALPAHLAAITWSAVMALVVFTAACAFRYITVIAPEVTAARETLQRLVSQIDATDKAKNAAHNDELQFEYDVVHRRTMLNVLRRTRDTAAAMRAALRTRLQELEALAAALVPPPIGAGTSALLVSIVDDADVDAWYERTQDDRRPFLRDFPITRSQSCRLPLEELRRRVTDYAAAAFPALRKLTLAGAARTMVAEPKLAQRLKRFSETFAPLVELRDDDLPAQQAMQRDTTLWIDPEDAQWAAQLQRRVPDAQFRSAPDALRVHAVSRALHYPAYVLGQFEYYRAKATDDDLPDLLPPDLALTGALRTAYEQVLLGRALGVIELRDGALATRDGVLGATHLAAAQQLAGSGSARLRERLEHEMAPRLTVARDVERGLRRLLDETPLTALDRGVVGTLVKRYGALF